MVNQHLEKVKGVYGNIVTFEECVIPHFSRKVFKYTATITMPVQGKATVMEEYGEHLVVPNVIIMEHAQHRVPVEMYNDSGEVIRIRNGQVAAQLHLDSMQIASLDQKGAEQF